MSDKDKVLAQALKMTPVKRAEIVDRLIKSLDKPDEEIDALWEKEAEDRIDAFESGDLQAVTLKEVVQKYKDL